MLKKKSIQGITDLYQQLQSFHRFTLITIMNTHLRAQLKFYFSRELSLGLHLPLNNNLYFRCYPEIIVLISLSPGWERPCRMIQNACFSQANQKQNNSVLKCYNSSRMIVLSLYMPASIIF